MPLLNLLIQTLGIQFNAAALGKKWRNEAYTQFYRFLDGEFHFIAARHHLAEVNMDGRFTIVQCAALDFNRHVLFTGIGDDGLKDVVAAVKQLDGLAFAHA